MNTKTENTTEGGPVSNSSSTDLLKIFLIVENVTDSLENSLRLAFYEVEKGFVSDEEEAKRIVTTGGVIKGTGWPIEKGKEVPRYEYRALKKFSL